MRCARFDCATEGVLSLLDIPHNPPPLPAIPQPFPGPYQHFPPEICKISSSNRAHRLDVHCRIAAAPSASETTTNRRRMAATPLSVTLKFTLDMQYGHCVQDATAQARLKYPGPWTAGAGGWGNIVWRRQHWKGWPGVVNRLRVEVEATWIAEE